MYWDVDGDGLITAQDLRDFEKEVAVTCEAGMLQGPVHLSGGNEDQLLRIFREISRSDWVFSTWRNHYHALLHGIPREWVMKEVLAGRSMNLTNHEHRFFTSAIVGGCLPIAVGVAAALKRLGSSERKVWCFVGDMAATTGAFHEASNYARCNDLPVMFVIENNGFSTDSPSEECWGPKAHREWSMGVGMNFISYKYERTYPHVGVKKAGCL